MIIGSQILHFRQVPSTIDICWQYATDSMHHGLVVYTDEQTQGRGQRGRRWHASPGDALLMSMLLHVDQNDFRPCVLSLWSAVALCQYLETSLKLSPRCKWPNDILIESKKVAGILVEQRRDWFVVGVGLNLNIAEETFQLANLPDAASLSQFTSMELRPEAVLQTLLAEWNNSYAELVDGKSHEIIAQWLHYSQLAGKSVTLVSQQNDYHGVLEGIQGGQLQLACDSGTRQFQLEAITSLRLA